jgi:hypothetical protein
MELKASCQKHENLLQGIVFRIDWFRCAKQFWLCQNVKDGIACND